MGKSDMKEEELIKLLDDAPAELASQSFCHVTRGSEHIIMDDKSLKVLKKVRLLKTFFLPTCYLAMGLVNGIQGPVLLDLADLFDSSIESLSSSLMFNPIGILVGSITGAFLTDRLTRYIDIILAINFLAAGLCIAAVPWVHTLELVALMFFVAGLGQGNMNVACSSLTMASWGPKTSAPIHALHALFSVGKLLGAPISGPFLSNERQILTDGAFLNVSSDNKTDYIIAEIQRYEISPTTHMENYHNFTNGYDNERNDRLYIPFTIVASILLLTGICLAGFHFLGWTFDKICKIQDIELDQKQEDNAVATRNMKDHTAEKVPCLKYAFFVVLFFTYVSITYRDSINTLFLFAIGVESSLQMQKPQAALMLTTYFACGSVGRLLAIFYSHCIDVHLLLFVQLGACLVLCVLMALLALDSVANLWILSNLLSFLAAPTYPTVMAWSNHYLKPTGIVVAIIDLGIGVGNFSATWLGGYLFDYYGGQFVFYLSLLFAVFMVSLIVPLQIVTRMCAGKKNNKAHELELLNVSHM